MGVQLSKWIRIAFINVCIVAFLGVLMRYKIAFSLPQIEQKHLQHAHSHFAFAAWISLLLYVFITHIISNYISPAKLKIFKTLIILNLITAFGMLVSFLMQGYGKISICFSVLSIIVSYLFTWVFFKHAIHYKSQPFFKWFAAALAFNVLSTFGTFSLAYLMVTAHTSMTMTLGSLYYYLHFQYNGWFLFGALGLICRQISNHYGSTLSLSNTSFKLLLFATIPAYFLSTLWANIPNWLYILTIIASILQFIAWVMILNQLYKQGMFKNFTKAKVANHLFILSIAALSIKFTLQLFSVIPAVSTLAFGFRPIVIAYLHLVLLAGFSLFLLAYINAELINIYKKASTTIFLYIVAFGVFLNEALLGAQGVAGFAYIPIPYIQELLFAAGLTMLIGFIGTTLTYSYKQ